MRGEVISVLSLESVSERESKYMRARDTRASIRERVYVYIYIYIPYINTLHMTLTIPNKIRKL